MQLADSPRKVALAFAKNGDKDTIPESSSPSAGRASMNDGFPPETRQPVGSGGIPPNGLDMNGILYYLSLLNRWQSASGGFVYDSVFANDADVGGYPKGAILLRSDGEGFWLNLADNNVNNPDTGGANWQPINNVGITSKTLTGSDVTLTNAEAAKDIIVLSGTLTANVNLIVPIFVKQWIVANNTTGAFTVTVKTVSGTGGLVTQTASRIFYGDGTNVYGVNPLAATQAQVNTGTDTLTFLTPKTFNDAQQFVDIDTELSNKADLNGNAAQEFAVATATTGNSAVNLTQLLGLVYPVGSVYISKTDNRNPNTILGIGTWIAVDGKALFGYKSGDADFGTVGSGGGSKDLSLTLTVDSRISATLSPPPDTVTATTNGVYSDYINTGDGVVATDIDCRFKLSQEKILPPYDTFYIWERTA